MKDLEQSGQLQVMGTENLTVSGDGSIVTGFVLPRQGVSLIKLEWE
ncbi:hypothetical protein [Niabella hibiscisoli]|nr:hypothetical protein [Niabella hibiscisoli]MCH5717956.1 hypothetical protein [Niabella hibiscisoli]